ncbi:MAG: hypothetical protein AAF514_22160, partial [Verrucomicrobiota bacterium]
MKNLALLFLVAFLLPSCAQVRFPTRQPTHTDFPATIEIVEAVATLHRLVPDPDNPMDDLFVLTTFSGLKVRNQTGKPIPVTSQFHSAYDDLRLRIRDGNGRRLVTTSHTLAQRPAPIPQRFVIPEGESFIQLVCATPVGSKAPREDFPYIRSTDLTKTVQLEFFGGFPGSGLNRAVQSNRVVVT